MTDSPAKVLTISIAAYNVAETLGTTLASLEADEQTMAALDIIVVDDGSTDRSAAAAQEFAARHPGSVRVISKANGGYGSTVNTAIECAKGVYFKLLDGDDTYDTQALAGFVRFLKGCNADLVLTPFVTEKEGTPWDLIPHRKRGRVTDVHQQLGQAPVSLEDAALTCAPAMFEICVRTDVLRKSGQKLTEHCFYTDNEFVMIAGLNAGTAVRYPEPIYRYRLGVAGQSMSVEGRRRHFDDKIRAAQSVIGMLRQGLTGSRKLLADEMVSMMIREVYVSAMLQDDSSGARAKLAQFEADLRQNTPEVQQIADRSRLVRRARTAGPAAFKAMSLAVGAREHVRTGSTAPVIAGYIAALCMIIQCRTIYMHVKDYGMIVNRVTWVVMMTALAVCAACCMSGRNLKDRKTWIICAALAVYTGIYMAVNPINLLRVIRCALTVALMLILARADRGPSMMTDIFRYFKNLMIVVGVISLIGYLFGSTIPLIRCTGDVWIDWSSTGGFKSVPMVHWIYFETQQTWWHLFHARNSAIFVEAPMAGFCFFSALLAECYICPCRKKRTHIVSVVFLVACIISTIPVLHGVLLLIMAVVALVRHFRKVVSLPRPVMAAGVVVVVALLALLVRVFYVKFVWGSGSARINDFSVGFHAWMNRPLFGGGWESLEYLQKFMPAWRYNEVGFSNSPFEILGQGGLYVGALYLYAFIAPLVRAVRRRDTGRILLIVYFAYLFIFTVVPYQYITFFFLIFFCHNPLDEDIKRSRIRDRKRGAYE